MPATKPKQCSNFATLVNFDRYLVNKLAKSHGVKIEIEKLKPIGSAPTTGFPNWVKKKRRRAMQSQHRHQGRPMTWGVLFMFTLPDWSDLSSREKIYYEKKLTRALDHGAVGILIWHNKRLFKTHDLNLLLAPFSVIGQQVVPRRDSQYSEWQRLRRVSDQAIDRINRRRRALHQREIDTMAQLQARNRAASKRKSLAATLADSQLLQDLLAGRSRPNPPNATGWLKTVRAYLLIHKITITHATPNLVLTVTGPQIKGHTFSLVKLIGEAKEIIRLRNQPKTVATKTTTVSASAQLPAPKPGHPAKPATATGPTASVKPAVKPVETPPVTNAVGPAPSATKSSARKKLVPTMTALAVIEAMIQHSPSPQFGPLKNEDDFQLRLQRAGFTFANEPNGQYRIGGNEGQTLLVGEEFVVLAQRQLLQHVLYAQGHYLGKPPTIPDFEAYNDSQKHTAKWNVMPFGALWIKAHEVCADVKISEKWQEKLGLERINSNVSLHGSVMLNLADQLTKAQLDPWQIFTLLQIHCGASLGLGFGLLNEEVGATKEFLSLRSNLQELYQDSTTTKKSYGYGDEGS